MTAWTKFVAPAAALVLGLSGATWWTVSGGDDTSTSDAVAAPLHRQTPEDGSTGDTGDTGVSTSTAPTTETTVATTVAPTVPPTPPPETTVPMTLPTTVAPVVTTAPPTTAAPTAPAVEVPAGLDVSTWQLCSSSAGWDVMYPSDWYAYVDTTGGIDCSLFAPFDMSDLTPDEAFDQSYVVVGRLTGYDLATYVDAFVTGGGPWEMAPVVTPVVFDGRAAITYEGIIPADSFDPNPWGVTEFVVDLSTSTGPEVGYVQAVFPMSYEYGVAAEMAQAIAATITFW
jgi:hypothetical protein